MRRLLLSTVITALAATVGMLIAIVTKEMDEG